LQDIDEGHVDQSAFSTALAATISQTNPAEALAEADGAGEGNRTLVVGLENRCSTIELHPRLNPAYQVQHNSNEVDAPEPVAAAGSPQGSRRDH
jgi:CII-binding regulator of phage lambda lysogenization HflD